MSGQIQQPKFPFGMQVSIPTQFFNKDVGTMTTDVAFYVKTVDLTSTSEQQPYQYGMSLDLPAPGIPGKGVVMWLLENELERFVK